MPSCAPAAKVTTAKLRMQQRDIDRAVDLWEEYKRRKATETKLSAIQRILRVEIKALVTAT